MEDLKKVEGIYSYVKDCRKYCLNGHNVQPTRRSCLRGQIFHTVPLLKKRKEHNIWRGNYVLRLIVLSLFEKETWVLTEIGTGQRLSGGQEELVQDVH